MRSEFITAINFHQAAFGLNLAAAIERLADYYELINEHNPILHLVGPCSPEEFAIRHILESLTLLDYLPTGAKFADVGTGAGLPSIPCLLVRADLNAVLIESKVKKAGFLRMALTTFGLNDRVQLFNAQFSEAEKPGLSFITCRALDKFSDKLPHLLKWSGTCDLLLFGGDSLRNALIAARVAFIEKLLPMSQQRFLFLVSNRKR